MPPCSHEKEAPSTSESLEGFCFSEDTDLLTGEISVLLPSPALLKRIQEHL